MVYAGFNILKQTSFVKWYFICGYTYEPSNADQSALSQGNFITKVFRNFRNGIPTTQLTILKLSKAKLTWIIQYANVCYSQNQSNHCCRNCFFCTTSTEQFPFRQKKWTDIPQALSLNTTNSTSRHNDIRLLYLPTTQDWIDFGPSEQTVSRESTENPRTWDCRCWLVLSLSNLMMHSSKVIYTNRVKHNMIPARSSSRGGWQSDPWQASIYLPPPTLSNILHRPSLDT